MGKKHKITIEINTTQELPESIFEEIDEAVKNIVYASKLPCQIILRRNSDEE